MSVKRSDSSFSAEKQSKYLSSPEQLNDYIRVTSPSVWFVLAVLTIILIGMLTWSVLGTVEVHNEDGTTDEIHPIFYLIN